MLPRDCSRFWLQDSNIPGKCNYCPPTPAIHPLTPSQTTLLGLFFPFAFLNFPLSCSSINSHEAHPEEIWHAVRWNSQGCISVAGIPFTMLCNHHHYLLPKLFITPNKYSVPVKNELPMKAEFFLLTLKTRIYKGRPFAQCHPGNKWQRQDFWL